MTTRPHSSDVIVILGMHRAGTSLCGRILQGLGADFGGALLSPRPDNPEGLFEHPGIVRLSTGINALLNRRLTSPTGTLPFPEGWGELPEVAEHRRSLARLLLDEMARAKSTFAFKDPNTVRILPLWQAIFAEHGITPRYVVTIRSPRPVALSLARRDRITPALGELLWAVHYADAIRYLDGRLNCVVSFDGWFERPEQQVERVARALGLGPPGDRAALAGEIKTLVRPDLRHHDAGGGCENPCAQRIHDALLDAVARAIDPAALLASIEPLDAAMKTLAPVTGSLEQLSTGNVRRVLRRFEVDGWVPRDWPPPLLTSGPAAGPGDAQPQRRPLRVGIVMPVEEGAEAADRLSHDDRGFLELGRALADAGHTVRVFFVERRPALEAGKAYLSRRGNLPERLELSSMDEGPVPCTLPAGTGHVGPSARPAYIAYQNLRDADLDVLHFADYKAPGYFVICAKLSGVNFQRTVICLHLVRPHYLALRQEQKLVSDPAHVIWNAMEDFCASRADYVASATDFLLRGLVERGAARRGKKVYLRRALPLEWSGAPSRKGKEGTAFAGRPKRLAFLGPLTMRGGVHLFCDAVRRLVGNGSSAGALPSKVVFLSEVQEAPEIAAVRAALRTIGVGLEFVAARGRAERSEYFRDEGALFVAPAICENVDYLALEAIHAGAAILISDTGGTAELLADPAAILINPHPQHIADAIRRSTGLPRGRLRPSLEKESEAWSEWHRSLQFEAESNRNVAGGMKEGAYAAASLHGGQEWQSHPGRYDEKGVLAERPAVDELLEDVERSIAMRERIEAAALSRAAAARETDLPLVSVVLAHYERPDMVIQAIRSIAAQRYPHLELILVDDGSASPRAREFLDRLEPPFTRVGWRVLRNSNLSPGASRNRGAEAARGAYVLCMDDDNVAMPHELDVLVHAARHANADVVTCFRDAFLGEAPPPDSPPQNRIVALGNLAPVAPVANGFGDANVLVKRNVYLKVGGYLEQHRTGKEDYEFFVRLSMAGAKFRVVPEALYWYRQLKVRRRNFHYNPTSGYLTVMAAFERHVPAAFRDVLSYTRALQLQLAPDPIEPPETGPDGDPSGPIVLYDIRQDDLVLRIGDAALEANGGGSAAVRIIRGDGSIIEVPIAERNPMASALPEVYRLPLPPGEGARTMAGDFEIHLDAGLGSGLTTRLLRRKGYQPEQLSGVCERVANGTAHGWIFDRLTLDWNVPLVAYLDDVFLGTHVAGIPRPDLQRQAGAPGPGRGATARGFEIPVPHQLLARAGGMGALEIRAAFSRYHLRRTPIPGVAGSMSWDREKSAWASPHDAGAPARPSNE
jgi:GT2 family glycosyltransferase/glycosyltransferase involved in cell wall biosynthesis